MTALFTAVFLASLLGSLHCVGMCGGLVTVWAGADATRGLARGAGHLAYNAGRLASYAALGAAAGALGATLDLAGRFAGVQRAALGISGVLILAWGSYALLQALGVRLPSAPVPGWLSRRVGRGIGAVRSRPPAVRAGVIGLLTGLLPCGWLYAFVVTAAGTGDGLHGALMMAVFWLGTLPALGAVGFGVQVLAGPLRRHVPAMCAIALMVVGLLTVLNRGRISAVLPPPPASVRDAAAGAQALGRAEPPCCAKHASEAAADSNADAH